MKNLLLTTILAIISFSLIGQTDILPPALDKPANAATNQMPDVQLDWFAVNGIGPISYEVQIDTNDQFPSPVTFTTSLSAQKMEFLSFGDQYYWRVRAMDNTGVSNWSDVRNFTIFNFVALYRPENERENQMPDALLKWSNKKVANYITGITNYDIEVSLTDDFANPGIVASVPYDAFPSNTTYFEYKTSNLLFDTAYYWRVRARHDVDTSLWSETWWFRTTDGVMLSSPANIEIVEVDDNTVNETVLCAKLFDNYYLSKSLDLTGHDTISIEFSMRADNKTLNSINFRAIDSNENIYCIVYFDSLFIMAYDGTTVKQLLQYQTGTSKWYAIKVRLDLSLMNYDIFIDNVQKANDYGFYENTAGLPSEFVWYNNTTIANKAWLDEISINADTELFFVEDFESGNLIEGDWFIEIPEIQPTDVELSWQPVTGTEKYIYQVSKSPEFAFPFVLNFTDNNSVVLPSLDFGSSYYYRIKTYHSIDTSFWSVTGKINIINTVKLISPDSAAIEIGALPTLKWNYIRGADQYELRWNNDDYSISDTVFADTTFFLMFKPLNMDEVYHWKVRAINNVDTTDWSEEWFFLTGEQGVESIALIKDNIHLFPNPSNGKLYVELNSERNTQIQITILDFVGKVVFDNFFTFRQGIETKKIELNNLNNGLYFVRFNSGDKVYTEKLIIDK